MRTLIDLPADDVRWLDRHAAEAGKSRAALVRGAVSAHRAEAKAPGDTSWIDAGFGLWRDQGSIIDPYDYERRRRAEWTRPWDDDYEVRAESPDVFDAGDDRQRQIYLDMVAERYPEPKQP